MSKKRKNPYEIAKRQKELERKKKKEQKKQDKLNKVHNNEDIDGDQETPVQ